MGRIRIDWFLVAIICAAIIGTALPAHGALVPTVAWLGKILIGLLFFTYGVRISPADTLAGLRNWRLHGLVFACTFVIFPILGLVTSLVVAPLLGRPLALGLLFASLVPSTVQSSVNFTSIAKGNVPAAVVSASVSNLIGVVITPLLAMALIGGFGIHIDPSSLVQVGLNILAPYIAGQLLRRWLAGFVARHKRLKLLDQASIVVIVYSAFSQARREHVWSQTAWWTFIPLVLVLLVWLGLMLWLTMFLAKRAKMDRPTQIAVQMCGTKKSLMSGLPMAQVLFANTGLAIGLVGLPLMVFHQLQLMACGYLAGRYRRQWQQAHPDEPLN